MLDRSGKAGALLWLVLLSGCSNEIGDDRLTWFWAVPPLAAFGVLGTFWILWHRKAQLARWDLRTSPSPPEGRWAAVMLSVVAGTVAVGFALVNLLAGDVDSGQKLRNILVWMVASTIAVGLAVNFGRMLAERGYARKEE